MKTFIVLLLTFVSLNVGMKKLYSQNSIPKIQVVLDGKKYDIDPSTMEKIDPMWLESIETLKNNGGVYLYPKKEFKDKCLAAMGLKEDTNIYKTVDSYPEFAYAGLKDTEESLKTFFRDKYGLPSELTGKMYNGNIYVYAIIEKNGTLSDIRVNKGGDEIVNKSIVNFLKNMPPWKPAKIKGDSVRYKYLFAIEGKWLK